MNRYLLVGALLFSVTSMAASVDQVTKQEIKWLESFPVVKEIGCNSYDKVGVTIDRTKVANINQSPFAGQRITANSNFICGIRNDYENNGYKIIKRENFKLDGVKVEIYHSDGSGVIGDAYLDSKAWHAACKSDAMTDEHTCAIMKDDLVIIKSKGGYQAIIGTKHFPNTTALIRIDKNKPIESGEKGQYSHQQSADLINEMANAKTVTTRFTQWPYEKNVDSTMDITNFNTAKKVLDLIYEKHN
ncbi:hypothetical protein M0J40_RS09315 [Providencia rettgeri]|nr:hypothetical protein [Providencia rettgeri]ELR5126662.1 hypothetical protein [Providencia rettgeri]ELR5243848.1 hypothetical protein [Providencia rettgeri]ELS4584853.1 hypothetical protein [Providencia rettgeri]